jgi:photosystem II stability/assembly factor-like uncharacterized protein
MTRRRWLIGVALGVLWASPGLADNYRWSSTGPQPGVIQQLVAHPSRLGEFYAVTTWDGLHRTEDGGESWVTMGQGNRDTGRWIALDPTSPDTFYVAAFRSILITRDRGRNFEQMMVGGPSHFVPYRVAVSADSTILYAVGPFVRRSTDGGETWSDSYTATEENFLVLETHPTEAGIAFLLTRNGLLRTDNGGESWEPFGTGLPNPFEIGTALSISPANPQVLLAGSQILGAYRSLDGGMTWNPVSSPLLSSVFGFAWDPFADEGVLVFGTPFDGSMALSADGGASWSAIGPIPDRFVRSAVFDPRAAGEIVAGVALFAFAGQVFRADDYGSVWTPLAASGLTGGYIWSVSTHPFHSQTAYAASMLGIHRTQNAGSTWEFLAPLPGAQRILIDRVNSLRLWAQVELGVQRSLDGGFTWSDASKGLPAELSYDLQQDPSEPDTIYLAKQNRVYKSTSGGDSWEPTGSLPDEVFPRTVAVDPEDSSIIYLGASAIPPLVGLYRSSDGGASWQPVAGGEGSVFDIQVDPSNPSLVYALSGYLRKSVDRGLSFSPATSWNGVHSVAFGLDPSNTTTLFVQDIIGTFRSPDAGHSWHRLTIESFAGGTSPTDVAVSADGRTLFSSNFGGVFTLDRRWNDLADTDPFFPSSDLVALHGVTAGCGGGNFCPSDPVSRAQSSVFLLRSLEGSVYQPPPSTGAVFDDVPADAFAAAWIEELSDRGITGGCAPLLFCPDADVTRAQAAVLNLRTKNGDTYQPPAATGTMFADVPLSHYAAAWIEEFARQGYTAGCAPSLYCPDQAVTRGQMAVFLAAVFALL